MKAVSEVEFHEEKPVSSPKSPEPSSTPTPPSTPSNQDTKRAAPPKLPSVQRKETSVNRSIHNEEVTNGKPTASPKKISRKRETMDEEAPLTAIKYDTEKRSKSSPVPPTTSFPTVTTPMKHNQFFPPHTVTPTKPYQSSGNVKTMWSAQEAEDFFNGILVIVFRRSFRVALRCR